MSKNKRDLLIKTASLDEAVLVHNAILEMQKTDKPWFEKRLKGKFFVCFVAYIKGEAVGYALRYDRYLDGSLYCWMGGVVPAQRRYGVMQALMAETYAFARTHGYKKLTLKTMHKHQAMIAFLAREGWRFVSGGEGAEDKLLYEKEVRPFNVKTSPCGEVFCCRLCAVIW